MIRPSNNPVTLGFGATTSPYTAANPHKGVDFGWIDSSGHENKTIIMPEDGTVSLVPNNGNDGNGVYFTVGNRMHGLLHTSQYLVGNGAFVKQGSPVAIMGATGAADGVHLHWALKVNGQFVNGLDYVEKENDDMVKPTEQEVHDIFMKFLQHDVANQDELNFYLNQDKRVLYEQVLYNGLCPGADEVNKAFADLQPWEPILDKQLPYYENYPKNVLYTDLAYGLKKQYDAGDKSEYELVTEPIYVKKVK